MKLIKYDNPIPGYRDFRDYQRHMEYKSRKSKKAYDRITEESRITLRWAKKQDVKVQPMPVNLLLLATEHYGNLPDEVGLIAYIRHNLTNYDILLKECENVFGREEAYQIIKEKVTRKICKRLNVPFSVEYLYNKKMPWLVQKDYNQMMEMYR